MNALTDPRQELLETVAKYSAHGIPDGSIREALGVSEEQLMTIKESDEYAVVIQRVIEDHVNGLIETDGNWDSIERKALENLVRVMEFSRDPELNLRVAAMANKAVRRNRPGNKPLDATPEGSRVVLTLSKRLTEQISQTGVTTTEEKQMTGTMEVDVKDLDRMFTDPDGSPSMPAFGETLAAE